MTSFIPYDPILILLAITIMLQTIIIILIILYKKIRKNEPTDEEIKKMLDQQVKL